LAGEGGQPYDRRRSLEFSADRTLTRGELIERLSAVVASCRGVVGRASEDDLAAPRTIQGYPTDGLRALLRVWEHMAYHTGQIVQLAKQLLPPEAAIDFHPQHKNE
jgi:hypothetical protein